MKTTGLWQMRGAVRKNSMADDSLAAMQTIPRRPVVPNMLRLVDLMGFLLAVYGPGACRDPATAFGTWCLDHMGGFAHRQY